MSIRRSTLTHYWLHLVLWIGVVFVLNHLSSQTFVRMDLTQDQQYTLSQVARQSMMRLKRPMQVRVYFTENLQAPYNNHKQALLDKLGELQTFSRGKMSIEVINPDASAEITREAQKLGVEGIPYRYKKGTLVEARTIFMGAVLFYGDRQLPVGPFVAPETMEYELVRAIRYITKDSKQMKTIGYLTSEGEPDLAKMNPKSPLGQFRDSLKKRHMLQAVSLGENGDPLANIDALFIMGPQAPMTPRAQYQLDQYLMSGKPVSIFLSAFQPDFASMRARPVRHGLNNLIGHYGLKLNKDAIVDRKNNERFNVPVTTGSKTRNVPINYPLIPVTTNINRSHLLGRGVHRMVLPFVSSITPTEELLPGVEIDELVSTGKESGRIQGLRHIQPNVFKVPVPGELPGPHLVGATVTGRLTSYFIDKPVPPPQGMAPDDPRFNADPTQTIIDGAPTRLLVMHSTDFMANNLPFMLNAADWMLDDPDLMKIRQKLTPPKPLRGLEGSEATAYKLGIVGIPLFFLCGLGGLIWVLNRRRT